MLLFLSNTVYAQKEANNWFFGDHIGYTFNTNPPSFLEGGQQTQYEGTAVISDTTGQLIMYTEGSNIWDGQHNYVPNATGDLKGHYSSSQSALIIPQPGNSDNYYVITADAAAYLDPPNEGINYSLVNLCATDNGIGVIDSIKNINLIPYATEKLTAVNHKNGTDVWVVAHEFGSNRFFCYLVTENVFSEEPVISEVGSVHRDFSTLNGIGNMKMSPNGKKLILAVFLDGFIEILDFDNETGKISNPFYFDLDSPFGVDFSASSRYAYAAGGDFIYQFDLAVDGYSPKLIFDKGDSEALQIAPDGKIYTHEFKTIENPDAPADSIVLDYTPRPLSNYYYYYYRLNVPNFNQSYFDADPQIYYNLPCGSLNATFRLTKRDKVASVKWDFGDGEAEEGELLPSYAFPNEGNYMVKAFIKLKDGRELERVKKVIINDANQDLLQDTVVCDGGPFILDVTQESYSCYTWHDGSNQPTFLADKSGYYWVDIRVRECTFRDSVYVKFETTPKVEIPDSMKICEGSSAVISATTNGNEVIWNTGVKSNEITVTQDGIYWIKVNNDRCTAYDSSIVKVQRLPNYSLDSEASYCEGDQLEVYLEDAEATYEWNDGVVNNSRSIAIPGVYWVRASINNCYKSDTINVSEIEYPKFEYSDTTICDYDSLVITAGTGEDEYTWWTGATSSTAIIKEAGNYSVEIENSCFSKSVNFNVYDENCECELFLPNVITPNNDERNDLLVTDNHQKINEMKFSVYNRWGKEVYSSVGSGSYWDGRDDTGIVDAGVYYYSIEYSCRDEDGEDGWYTINGWVQVVY